MQQSGFRSCPITQLLTISLLTASLLASLTSTKQHFHLQLSPHLLPPQLQLHRLTLFQTLYANSGELFFALVLVYHLRVIERLFSSRKLLSCVIYTWSVTSLAIPLLLALGWLLSGGRWNYIPPGPTPVLFALLAQYHAAVPSTYKLTVGDITVSDKVYTYVIAGQLVLSQFPGSAIAAAVGWVVGYLWRFEVLPGTKWRVGRGIVRILGGEVGEGEYEGLRQRLRGQRQEGERRPVVERVLDTFRGAF